MFHPTGSDTVVPLDLPAAGSVFVVFRPGQPTLAATRLTHNSVVLMDALDSTRIDQGTPASFQGLTPADELQPWVDNPLVAAELIDGGQRLLAWEKGSYTLTHRDQPPSSITATKPQTIRLNAPWTLAFPSGWDAPSLITLPTAQPWSALTDPATRAFSGTATYRTTIDLPAPSADTRLMLDLGRVADLATISINGEFVTTLWGPPFRADITPFIKAGPNQFEVKVTNTWYNRLTYDASLPADQRKTWTINSPAATDPLAPAGISGPVTIRSGQIIELPSDPRSTSKSSRSQLRAVE